MSAQLFRAYTRVRRVVIISLSLTAVIIGLLAMHSMAGVHSSESLVVSSAQASGISGHAHVAIQPPSTARLANGSSGPLSCGDECTNDCMVMAASCLTLVVLAVLVLLATSPATLVALIDRGRLILAPLSRARVHVYFPSLVELSISRT